MGDRSTFYVLRSAFNVLLRCVQSVDRRWILDAAGTGAACVTRMIARKFQDLEAWQLANSLKLEVYKLTESDPARSDYDYCRQIRKSAASSPRNIAEGFGRFRPRPFAQYMEFSIGSTQETHDALLDGVHRGHFTSAKIAPALSLLERCLKVSTKLLLYLKRCKDDDLPFL
jgi:four helix bundle protein